MGDYGYVNREDLAARFVESQVTEPPRTQARSVGRALRQPSGSGAGGQILSASKPSAIGAMPLFLGAPTATSEERGTGTVTVTPGGWHATLKRHGNRLDVRSTAGNRKQYYSKVELMWSPMALLDVTRAPVPVVVTMEDVVGFDVTNPAAGIWGQMYYGLFDSRSRTSTTDPLGVIGFIASASNASSGTWNSYVSNETAVKRRTVLTGYESDAPNLLTLEIDGWLKQIRWLVNGTEVDTWAPTAADLPTVNASIVSGPSCVLESDNDADVDGLVIADGQSQVSVSMLDETGA